MTWTKELGKSVTVGISQLAMSAVTEQDSSVMRAGLAAGSRLVATSLPIEKIGVFSGSKEERALNDIIAASLIQATSYRFVLESEMSFLADSMMSLGSQVLGTWVYDVLEQSGKMRGKASVASRSELS